MARMRNLLLAFLIIMVLTTGCFEEHLTVIIYDEYVPPTLPPIGIGSVGQKIFTPKHQMRKLFQQSQVD
jgi:hypothetical protein